MPSCTPLFSFNLLEEYVGEYNDLSPVAEIPLTELSQYNKEQID
jgi:hypothetical protein